MLGSKRPRETPVNVDATATTAIAPSSSPSSSTKEDFPRCPNDRPVDDERHHQGEDGPPSANVARDAIPPEQQSSPHPPSGVASTRGRVKPRTPPFSLDVIHTYLEQTCAPHAVDVKQFKVVPCGHRSSGVGTPNAVPSWDSCTRWGCECLSCGTIMLEPRGLVLWEHCQCERHLNRRFTRCCAAISHDRQAAYVTASCASHAVDASQFKIVPRNGPEDGVHSSRMPTWETCTDWGCDCRVCGSALLHPTGPVLQKHCDCERHRHAASEAKRTTTAEGSPPPPALVALRKRDASRTEELDKTESETLLAPKNSTMPRNDKAVYSSTAAKEEAHQEKAADEPPSQPRRSSASAAVACHDEGSSLLPTGEDPKWHLLSRCYDWRFVDAVRFPEYFEHDATCFTHMASLAVGVEPTDVLKLTVRPNVASAGFAIVAYSQRDPATVVGIVGGHLVDVALTTTTTTAAAVRGHRNAQSAGAHGNDAVTTALRQFHIPLLYVTFRHRGEGVARMLFEAGCHVARCRGATRLSVLNPPQLGRFWKSFGFYRGCARGNTILWRDAIPPRRLTRADGRKSGSGRTFAYGGQRHPFMECLPDVSRRLVFRPAVPRDRRDIEFLILSGCDYDIGGREALNEIMKETSVRLVAEEVIFPEDAGEDDDDGAGEPRVDAATPSMAVASPASPASPAAGLPASRSCRTSPTTLSAASDVFRTCGGNMMTVGTREAQRSGATADERRLGGRGRGSPERRIVGFLSLRPTGWIAFVVCHVSMRGQGLGTMLIAMALEWLRLASLAALTEPPSPETQTPTSNDRDCAAASHVAAVSSVLAPSIEANNTTTTTTVGPTVETSASCPAASGLVTTHCRLTPLNRKVKQYYERLGFRDEDGDGPRCTAGATAASKSHQRRPARNEAQRISTGDLVMSLPVIDGQEAGAPTQDAPGLADFQRSWLPPSYTLEHILEGWHLPTELRLRVDADRSFS